MISIKFGTDGRIQICHVNLLSRSFTLDFSILIPFAEEQYTVQF
jgi:hypothetical protein